MTRQSFRRNNVHISGNLVKETEKKEGKTILEMASPTHISAMVEAEQWDRFKSEYPNIKTISLSGILNRQIVNGNTTYFINVINDNSICCFHNLLDDDFDLKTRFSGAVRLKKKFNFDIESHMYLKRLIFETIGSGIPTTFEAVALRSIAPYFDEIEEGDELILKAIYVSTDDGYNPYWRITNKPVLI